MQISNEISLTPELLAEALPLVKALYQEHHGVDLPGLNANHVRDALAADVGRLVTARSNNTLVGFAWAYVTEDLLGRKAMSIQQLYVSPAFRAAGRSAAVQLVTYLRSMAASLGVQDVTADVAVQGNLAFYQAMGAEVVGYTVRFKNG